MAWSDAPPTQQELNQVAPAASNWASTPPTAQELAATQPSGEPGQLEALARGAGQGLTLGAEPAIAGAGSGALAALSPGATWDDIVKAYKAERDSEKGANDKASAAHPVTSFAGNLVGGLPLALLTDGATEAAGIGGVGTRAMTAGAALGAGAGVGNAVSEGKGLADTTKDAIGGGLTGAATGGALRLLQGVGSELSQTEAAQNLAKAFKYGTQGTDLVTKAGGKAAQEGISDASRALGMELRDANKSAGQTLGAVRQAMQAGGQTVDTNPTISGIQKAITNLNASADPDAASDAAFLQKYMDNLTKGSSTAENPIGINPDTTNFDTANQMKQTLTRFGGNAGNNAPLKTNEATNAMSGLAKDLNNNITGAVAPGAEGPATQLASATNDSKLSYGALKSLGLDDSDFSRNPITGEMELNQDADQSLKNKLRQLGRGPDTQAGQNSSDRINNALEQLQQIDPEAAQRLGPQVQQAAEQNALYQKGQGNLLTKSGLLSTAPVQVGNRLGNTGVAQGISKAASFAGDTVANAVKGVSNSDLVQGAKSMMATGSPVAYKLASQVADAASKTGTARNAALFSLLQQPGYRDLVKTHIPGLATQSDSNQGEQSNEPGVPGDQQGQ